MEFFTIKKFKNNLLQSFTKRKTFIFNHFTFRRGYFQISTNIEFFQD
jgi:hypothetical protein